MNLYMNIKNTHIYCFLNNIILFLIRVADSFKRLGL